jgi:ubiquinone/menaquinone biosynthesis C-methylase UbiE
MTINIFEKFRVKFIEKDQERKENWDKIYFYRYSYKRLHTKKNVLDLGCGVGHFLKLTNGNIVGIDVNHDSLKESKKYSNKLVRGSILQLPFSSESFDGINCSHVIEHLMPDDAYQLLVEMNRILKIGGTLIISTPLLWEGFFEDFTHIKPYYPEAIMHYYGKETAQTTKGRIDCFYEIEEIKWRYANVPLGTFLFPKAGVMNTLFLLITEYLSSIGFGKYSRNGYTMILRKVR